MSSCVKEQRLALRDANLQVNEIEAGDQFGDGMLDLEARVHLEKIEIPVSSSSRNSTVPALVYPCDCASRTAASPMRRRSSQSTTADGASSITF